MSDHVSVRLPFFPTGLSFSQVYGTAYFCDPCGCLFLPEYADGFSRGVYPDRFEMAGGCGIACECHDLPRFIEATATEELEDLPDDEE